MRRGRTLAVVLGALVLLLVVLCGSAGPTESAATLRKAAADSWAFLVKESPALRMREGLSVDRLPDVSVAHVQAIAAFGKSLLGRLAGVPEGTLPRRGADARDPPEGRSRGARRPAGALLADFPGDAVPVSVPRRQFGRRVPSVSQQERRRSLPDAPFPYPGLIRALESKLREQEKRGVRLAKEEIPLVAGAFTAAGLEKEQSLFWVKPERLSSLGAADRDAFAARLSDLLASNVRPAVASLMTYLTGEYMAKALDAVGLAQYLGGNGYYRALVRRTTLPGATPEEIHKIGLEAIDRLNTELDAVRKKVGFAGSLAEFRQHLKTDARFFARTPEEVGERLMAAQNWILPKIPEFFGKIPKASFGVQRPEPQLEGALTFGYYQTPTARDPKGYYKDNGSNLKERSLLGAGSSSSPAITSRSTCSTRLRACRSSGASPSTPL